MCPWVGHANEAKIKEEILSLSAVSSVGCKNTRVVVIEYATSILNVCYVPHLLTYQDRRNFVRAPPAGVEFEFDYDSSYPVALAIMNDDKELEKMRFELVPKM